MKKSISLKLPEELLARLDEESVARDVSKSSVVRECLEQGLASARLSAETSCYDLARDLAGMFKGAPKDLATNPKYMEGFGE